MEIESVILKARDIDSMRRFYIDLLNFTEIERQEGCLSIKVGHSVLQFLEEKEARKPFYHFAFNIPSNQFKEAKDWVRDKVCLNTEGDKDEIVFERLGGRSFYFNDPGGNIVEFISREQSPLHSGPFCTETLLNISEMSLTVSHVLKASEELQRIGLTSRDNDPINRAYLNFMGDDGSDSYLLLVEPERRWIFSTQVSEVHPLEVVVKNIGTITVDKHGRLTVVQA
ncbi:VOC family protein [Halobacillus sp. SY10]|uniref:VOC domain-containing protein n=1 Tax=Halobacillus aidingensis TaxID=240303 RepID=A0A1H0FSK0_HALAD|nr:VOC family protein [Halobacillus aidingensis]SDN97459.1 hypothetical protein SAMN05421677_10295 [Halobacillus aidingensis]